MIIFPFQRYFKETALESDFELPYYKGKMDDTFYGDDWKFQGF